MYAAKVLGKMESWRNADGESRMSDFMKANMKAAVIGGAMGLVVGYSKGYNLLITAIIGAGAATLVSSVLIKKFTNDEQ